MEGNRKLFTRKYIIYMCISLLVLCVFSIIIFLINYYLSTNKSIFVILTDSFSIPLIVFVCIYFLIKLTNYGAFDALSYSVKLIFNSFKKDVKKDVEPSFYDYKENKNKKERTNLSFMLFSCIPFLILTIIFLVLSLV